MLEWKLTELDTKQEIFYHSKSQRPFDKMFNMIPPEMHSDTRQLL
jgi:hypothetical protein